MNAAVQTSAAVAALAPRSIRPAPRLAQSDLSVEALPLSLAARQEAQQGKAIEASGRQSDVEQAKYLVAQGWKHFCKAETWRKVGAVARLVAVEAGLYGLSSALMSSGIGLIPLFGMLVVVYPMMNSVSNNRTEQRRAVQVRKLAGALQDKTPEEALPILKKVKPADYELMLRGCQDGISESFGGAYFDNEYQVVTQKQSLVSLEKISTMAWALKERLAEQGGFVPPPAWLKERLTAIMRSNALSSSALKKACHLIGVCKAYDR